jgi:SRSO17 transposase
MPTILESPQAQSLLDQAAVDPDDLRPCTDRLGAFLDRYLPLLTRSEQRRHAATVLRGKLSELERKTTEPLASDADQYRRPLQQFVGAGGWSDEALRAEMARHVAEEIGAPGAVLVLDPSAFPKKGTHSCGVGRQWCGRLGKIDNCQVGVFLGYVAPRGKALIDARLYLPPERVHDAAHREKTRVPDEVGYREKWRIGLDLLLRRGAELPHGWVAGDEELGRVTELRSALRLAGERYALDVPRDTLVRDLSDRPEPRRPGGRRPVPPWERVDAWAKRQPESCWQRVTIRQGTKGPLEAEVLLRWVQTRDEEGGPGPRELLAVIRGTGEHPETWYVLSNARDASAEEVARAHGCRHGIEELFAEGNAEVGLDHYEVRSWVGWSHHVTLSMLALWFLQTERVRLGGKNAGDDGVSGAADLRGAVASPGGPGAVGTEGERGAQAQ